MFLGLFWVVWAKEKIIFCNVEEPLVGATSALSASELSAIEIDSLAEDLQPPVFPAMPLLTSSLTLPLEALIREYYRAQAAAAKAQEAAFKELGLYYINRNKTLS